MTGTTEAQAPTETIVAPTETPAPITEQTPIEQRDQLEQLLADPEWKPEIKTEAPATESEPEPEPVPTGEQPPEPTPVMTPEETLPAGIERPRLQDPQDQVIAALKKSRPELTWAECETRVKGAPAKVEPIPEPEPQVDPMAALQEEMTGIDAKLKEATEGGAVMDGEMLTMIQRRQEIATEITTERKLAERDQRSKAERDAQRAEQAKYEAKGVQQKAVEAAHIRFPALLDEKSAVRAEAERLLKENAGKQFLHEPDAPMTIAEKAVLNVAKALSAANGTSFAEEYAKLDSSIKHKAEPVRTEAPKPAVVQKKVTVAGGAQATRKPDQSISEADQFKDVSNDPRAEQERLNSLLYGT